MTNKNKFNNAFWKKLRNNYRLQLIDTDTYDVRWVLELNRLNILIAGLVVFLLFLILSFLFFAFTPMKFLLPGFVGTNADDKRELIALKMQSERLEKNLLSYNGYVDALVKILRDSQDLHPDIKSEQARLLQADTTLFFPNPGKLESRFRKDFELLLKQGSDPMSRNDKLFVLNEMQNPIEGKPVALSPNEPKLKGLKIKGNGEAGITSVLSGVIVAKYKVGDETHIFIQHEDYLLSVYKFDGVAKVTPGEEVDKGQLIGVLRDGGAEVLYLELWANAESIPPGQYLKY
jgi:murein DD-endopeptidase MepM/ murein hydrolase activator NlpD